jgi:putative lipoprotein
MQARTLAGLAGAAFLAMACSNDGGDGAAADGAAAAPTASEARATLTGSVGYRQRIALPPGAVVKVRLEDISLADAKARVLDEQIIEASGQVPIPFELAYDPAAIDPRHRYAVRAQIWVEDELWFSTTRVNPALNEAGTGPFDLMLDMVRQ